MDVGGGVELRDDEALNSGLVGVDWVTWKDIVEWLVGCWLEFLN